MTARHRPRGSSDHTGPGRCAGRQRLVHGRRAGLAGEAGEKFELEIGLTVPDPADDRGIGDPDARGLLQTVVDPLEGQCSTPVPRPSSRSTGCPLRSSSRRSSFLVRRCSGRVRVGMTTALWQSGTLPIDRVSTPTRRAARTGGPSQGPAHGRRCMTPTRGDHGQLSPRLLRHCGGPLSAASCIPVPAGRLTLGVQLGFKPANTTDRSPWRGFWATWITPFTTSSLGPCSPRRRDRARPGPSRGRSRRRCAVGPRSQR